MFLPSRLCSRSRAHELESQVLRPPHSLEVLAWLNPGPEAWPKCLACWLSTGSGFASLQASFHPPANSIQKPWTTLLPWGKPQRSMAEGHFLMGQWASKSKEPGPVTWASEWEEAEGWIGARACWAEQGAGRVGVSSPGTGQRGRCGLWAGTVTPAALCTKANPTSKCAGHVRARLWEFFPACFSGNTAFGKHSGNNHPQKG